jgi:two-component system, OmpR family, sensor histidine kinase MtrB
MFGLGALLLSASMGMISYVIVRHVLVGERESTSQHAAFVSAVAVRTDLLHQGSHDVTAILTAANAATPGARSVLRLNGQWFASPLSPLRDIPTEVRSLVASGTAATQTYSLDGTPEIAVGVPIPSVNGEYFQLFNEGALAHTLRVLTLALFGAGLVTTVLGAVVGRWASGGSLRPLTGVSRAAVAIAGGRLDTRLSATTGDPDLEGLTSSFNLMVDQLQERIEREARFTSDVSHELRSPLTTMGTSLDVLESHVDELSAPGQRALQLLAADLRRFQRMVGDLLEISRSDSGSADVWLEEVDPGELLHRAVAAAARSLPADTPIPPVRIDPELAGTRLSVDKRRFERVMTNLLENAALYGGGATSARVEPGRTERGTAWVRFSVEDHGPGIAPPERAKIFERFYRGHVSGRRGSGTGTGLGLALVAEHVRLHGGRVWVDQANGGGARFTIELPARDGSETEHPSEPEGSPDPEPPITDEPPPPVGPLDGPP